MEPLFHVRKDFLFALFPSPPVTLDGALTNHNCLQYIFIFQSRAQFSLWLSGSSAGWLYILYQTVNTRCKDISPTSAACRHPTWRKNRRVHGLFQLNLKGSHCTQSQSKRPDPAERGLFLLSSLTFSSFLSLACFEHPMSQSATVLPLISVCLSLLRYFFFRLPLLSAVGAGWLGWLSSYLWKHPIIPVCLWSAWVTSD